MQVPVLSEFMAQGFHFKCPNRPRHCLSSTWLCFYLPNFLSWLLVQKKRKSQGCVKKRKKPSTVLWAGQRRHKSILHWYHQVLQKLLPLHCSVSASLRTDLLLATEKPVGKLESFLLKLRISKSPLQGCCCQSSLYVQSAVNQGWFSSERGTKNANDLCHHRPSRAAPLL